MRTSDIYSYISTLVSLTGICEVFSQKPPEKDTPSGSYLYISKVSDNPDVNSHQGILTKISRISFIIVSKIDYLVGEDQESVLMDIVQVLDNEIAKESCSKIYTLGNIETLEILSDSISPIFYNEKNRPYIVKDYLITYKSQ